MSDVFYGKHSWDDVIYDEITCPRCGGVTTEEELTYSGCAECQAESSEE